MDLVYKLNVLYVLYVTYKTWSLDAECATPSPKS